MEMAVKVKMLLAAKGMTVTGLARYASKYSRKAEKGQPG